MKHDGTGAGKRQNTLCNLFVEELGHFAVVTCWCAAGKPCDHQHNRTYCAMHVPDIQRLALVEEHEGARIVKIVSKKQTMNGYRTAIRAEQITVARAQEC